MALYSVNDLIKLYNNEMTAQTIYKYFAKEELKDYVVQEKGKRLKAEGIPVLNQLRKDAEKYRQKKPSSSNNNIINNEFQVNAEMQKLVVDAEKYKLLAEEYKKQVEIKDNQINELHQIITRHVDTIQKLNGTLQLQAGNDILEKNAEEKEDINYIDTAEKIEIQPTSCERKGFFGWLNNIFK